MDRYHTAESWTGVPGAIAPADGNAVAQALRPEGVSSAISPALAGRKSGTSEGVSYRGNGAAQQNDGAADPPVYLGPKNERLDEGKPEMANALRGLERRYPHEGAL